jgi:hypothetical protein
MAKDWLMIYFTVLRPAQEFFTVVIQVFQRIVGIPMGTNCAALLDDLLL